MNNTLKQILLKIARLPQADQKWISNQLPSRAKQIFNALRGEQLLQEAQRFAKLPANHCNSLPAISLPDYCHLLANKAPLYIAIVLQQGNYPWQKDFLTRYDSQNLVNSLLKTQLNDIKISTKKAVFQQWQESVSFASFLRSEPCHD